MLKDGDPMEKGWAVYHFSRAPDGKPDGRPGEIGKVVKRVEGYISIRHSEGDASPSDWNANYVQEFEDLANAVTYFSQKTGQTHEEIRRDLSRRFPVLSN